MERYNATSDSPKNIGMEWNCRYNGQCRPLMILTHLTWNEFRSTLGIGKKVYNDQPKIWWDSVPWDYAVWHGTIGLVRSVQANWSIIGCPGSGKWSIRVTVSCPTVSFCYQRRRILRKGFCLCSDAVRRLNIAGNKKPHAVVVAQDKMPWF
jgi:hypothetical protein